MGRLRLLPRAALVQTSAVDHADWNYRPLLGQIQRLRFRLLLGLLGNGHFGHLLEVGYGSGVLMPELARRCDHLYGIDPHTRHSEVTAALEQHGIAATLASASVTEIPFADATFDCAVSVSAMEYVDDIDGACRELRRVLKPGGVLVLVTPGHSPLLDFGLKVLTGESADQNYANRRERLVPALGEHFQVDRVRKSPRLVSALVTLYTGLRLRTAA